MAVRRTRIGARWEFFFDLIAAATVIASAILALTTNSAPAAELGLQLALLAVGCGLLAVRRRLPLVAAAGSVLTSGLALLTPGGAVAVWVLAEVCLFSLPLRRSRAVAVAIGALHAALLYVGAIVVFRVTPVDPVALILPVWTGAVVAFGAALRNQQDYVDALEERAHSAAAIRESEVLRRVGLEHLRVARDLHDSVANSIAIINLESANALRHADDDTDRVKTALGVIRTVTKSTLAELADILAVLRDDPEDTDRTVATAANIPHLIELLNAVGFPVQADLDALTGTRLDPAADAALYRVAQESLTNAHRHGRQPVRLEVAAEPETVTLTVTNELDAARPATSPGFGLVGMRERIELASGTLEAGIRGSRFVVRAVLPRLAESAAPGGPA